MNHRQRQHACAPAPATRQIRRAVITSSCSLAAVVVLAVTPVHAEEDAHHNVEEVLVQATALKRTVEQLAQPTAVLGDEELAKKTGASIGETLSGELGLSSSYFGPTASRPVIRGQSGERVRVLSNGLDALDASALSEDHQSSVDSILAQRVEIVRGPATLLYGSGASGGLVNVVDNRIVEQPVSEPLQGKLAFNTGTAIGETSAAGWIKFGNDRLSAHLDYFRRDTDDVEIPGLAESAALRALEDEEQSSDLSGGVIENSNSSTEGSAIAATWNNDAGFVGVAVSLFDSRYSIPGGHEGHAAEEEEENVSIGLDQSRIDLKGEYALAGPFDRVRFRAANNDYEHTEFEGSEVGTRFFSDGLDGRIEFRHAPWKGFEGAVGAQYKRIDFAAIGAEAYVPSSNTRRASLFAFEEWIANETLVLQGSLRAEAQSIEGATLAADYDETAFGGALGAIWQLHDELTLSLRYSLTERHPNSTELYANGPHVAVNRFERGFVTLGNGILDKELSRNIDVTLRGQSERINWNVTLFSNEVDDYIALSPTGEIEDELAVFDYVQLGAELYGFEAEAFVELFDTQSGHLHARFFTDYVHGEQQSGAYLPRIPPLRVGAGLHYTADALQLGLEASRYDRQSKTASNELPTDSYTMIDAEVSWAADSQGLFFFLRGTNLGDREARQHASPLKDQVPLPGRSIHAGVRLDF